MHHLHIFTAGQVSIITFGVHRGISAWKQIQTEILFRLMTHDLSGEFVLFHIRWADKQAQQNSLTTTPAISWLFLGFRNVRVLAAQQGPQNLKFETNARLEVLWLYNACCFKSVEFANLLAPAHSTMSKAFSHPMLSLWHIKGTCTRMLFPSENGPLLVR